MVRRVSISDYQGSTSLTYVAARRWIERGLLTDAKGSVRCVEFGPSAFGLKLVSDLELCA